MNNLPCNCRTSPFADSNHGHIVAGDKRIFQNIKLRKLICKGPNYREPVSVNFSNCETKKTKQKNQLWIDAIKWKSLSNDLQCG